MCSQQTHHIGSRLLGYSMKAASISPNERTGLQGAERLDAVICQFLREQNVPGATLAVAKHGRLVYEQGYGVAGAGRRMQADTMLRVASISKPITAIAVMRLCQEGRLSLDARVFGSNGILKRLRPHGDKRLKQVTVRHLMQHSAGWDRDMVSDAVFENVALPEGMERTSAGYNAHLLQRILFRKLQFTPGSRHAYSNLGYLVLGEVIEAVTGQSYERYLQSLLAAIAITGMYVGHEERASWRSTEGEYFNIREPSTAPSVMPRQADSQVLPQYGSFLMRNTGAYGGWVASARDLVNVLCCLEEAAKGRLEDDVSGPGMQQCESPDAVLNASSVSAMLECPSYESGGRGGDWYGLGLDVQDGGQTWGHTGAMEGTSATCQRHHSGLIWAFILNAWTCNMDLDGVVKSALSAVPQLSPFPVHLAQVCGGKELQVQTADQQQCVVMHAPLHRLFPLIVEKNNEGFTAVWLSANTVAGEEGVDFNVVFAKSSALLGEKWVLLTEVSNLSAVLKRCTEEGVYPELITTYVTCGTLQAVVILAGRNSSCVCEVDVCVPVSQYLPLLTRRKKNGFSVVSQCVLQCPDTGLLLVTAIMKKEENTNDITNSSDEVNVAKKTEGEDKRFVETDDKEPLRTHTEEGAQSKQTEHRGGGKIEHCGHFENERMNIESSISAESESDGYLTSDRDRKTEDVVYFHAEKSEDSVSEDVTNPKGGGSRANSVEFANESGGDVSSESVGHPNKDNSHREGKTRSSCSSVGGRQSPLYVYPSPFDTSDTLDKTDCHFQKECEKSNRSPVLDNSDCGFQNVCPKFNHSSSEGARLVSSPTKRKTKQRPVTRLKTLSYVQLEVDSFVTEMGRQAKHGCGLQNVQFFPVDGKWYVSAVWSPACTRNSYHRMAVSRLGLLPALAEAAARNVHLTFVCQYEEEGATYYALFWEGPPFGKVTRKRRSSVS